MRKIHTELYNNEKQLRENELNMRIFMQSTSDCIWNWDMANNTVERSIGFERAFGYLADEIEPGINWWIERLHPDDHDRVMNTFSTACDTGESVCNYEYRFRCKDGSYAIVDDRVTIIRDRNKTVTRSMGAMHDITQRRKAENSLANTYKSLQQIQFAIDRIGIGIHMVGLDGRFLYVNDAAANMLGYSRKEMLEMSVPDIDPNYPKEKFIEVSSQLKYASPGKIETTQLTKDGHLIPVEVSFYFHPGENGEEGIFIGFNEDLREKKRIAEEQQQLNDKLANASKMETIGRLSGGLAHDFNNILASIMGYTELLKSGLNNVPLNSKSCHEYINHILGSSNRAKDIVAQMLLFSRKDPGYTNNDKQQTIKSWSVVKETIELLRASIPKGINIASSTNDELATAQMQPIHLHQILLNLAINARDAIGNHGTITFSQTVKTTQCTCDSCFESLEGRYVIISVTDTGDGILPKDIKHIFVPFYSSKPIGKGSGMGLSIVHGIVHSANGHITISKPDHNGTCFNICLPCPEEEEEVQTDTDKSTQVTLSGDSMGLEGISILVVDDEASLVNLLDEFLTTQGAIVSSYTDPQAALTDFTESSNNYDLLITDYTMPGLSGLELAQQVLQKQAEIPIILSTGYSEDIEGLNHQTAGISHILHKPFNLQTLLNTINDLVSQNSCDLAN
ncbi:MAG: PAS domain S-box protein [Gammaproteobacteria bacterium]|nr:PAS domain S-box protein [Gammaproteobacteria bacterium]